MTFSEHKHALIAVIFQREAWVQGIVKQYQKLHGTTAEQAKALYLESVRSFKHYGAALYSVKVSSGDRPTSPASQWPDSYASQHKGDWSFSESILLAVFSEGIDFVNSRTNETMMSFTFKDIKNYEHENNLVSISAVLASDAADFETTEVFQFFTDQAEEIVSLIREYCPTTEYMKKVKESSAHDVDITSLIRDVDKYRAALLDHGMMRRPGPEGGNKRAKGGLRRLFTTSSSSRQKSQPSPTAHKLERSPSTVSRRSEDSTSASLAAQATPDTFSDASGTADDYTIADWSFSVVRSCNM